MKTFRILVFFTLATGMYLPAGAQVINEIINKLDLYHKKYSEENVYLQTDRSVYAPGETIWFKAWLLSEAGIQPKKLSNYLYISMIDKDSIEVLSHVLPFSNDQLSGNLVLPQLLNPGNYKLIAYTSWMKNMPADRIFDKNILIEIADENALHVDLQLAQEIAIPGSQATVVISTVKKDGSAVSANIDYEMVNKNGILSSGKGKTDKAGKMSVTLSIPEAGACEGLKLVANVSHKAKHQTRALVMPVPANSFNILFYPEGGLLLYGIDTKVAFRAFNKADRPVDFKGAIYTNENKLAQQIESTYQGIGSFNLDPEKGKTYYLKITQPAGITQTFELPAPRRAGLALRVDSRTKDTLTLVAEQTSMYPNVYSFVGQVNGRVYWMETIKTSEAARLKVPLDEFPAGVAEFAAFDTLKNLLAKRLVYLNDHKRLYITLKPDKTVYAPREKVTLTIEARDDKGQPVEASLALAVVLSGQSSNENNSNLFTYNTLKNNLIGFLPTPGQYFTTAGEASAILDNLLIANTFKRFTWRTVLGVNEASVPFKSMEENGNPLTTIAYDRKVASYFAQDILNSMCNPGHVYTDVPENDMDRILNPAKYQKKAGPDYSKMKDVDEIVYTVKPYKIIDGKIVFHSSSPNTLMHQQGAAIAIDGVYRGTDPTIFSTLTPMDIDRVVISTNPVDVQKYTGLNSIGIIEIFTKSGNASLRTTGDNKPQVRQVNVNVPFDSPHFESGATRIKAGEDQRITLYWDPQISTGSSGKATITFFNGDTPSTVEVFAEGISANPGNLTGYGSVNYTISQ
ncbi:MAG: hypothetical protein JXQ80_08105 [Bacteroidales bacterium]|nr:hypothetical protein [Bacteroidales bacterium]